MKLSSYILISQILFLASCVSANAIQLMEPEPQGLVSGAEQNAEELLVKAKKSQITEGPQMKAMTKDPIQQLKRRGMKSIYMLQEMTSYRAFAADLRKLKFKETSFSEVQSYAFKVLKEFELEAGHMDRSFHGLTVAKLLGEYQTDFSEDEDTLALGERYAEILHARFAEPGMFALVAKFINGLRLGDRSVQLLFPYHGRYLPILQKALMTYLYSEDVVSNEETSNIEDYHLSTQQNNDDLSEIEQLHNQHDEESYDYANAKMILKIDKEGMNATKSVGLKQQKTKLANAADLRELEQKKRVTFQENDKLNMKMRSSKKLNLEHNNDSALSDLRRRQKQKKARSEFSNNMKSQATQKLRQPGFQKFAQVAAEFGMPLRYSDAHKNLDFFWTHPNMDDLDQGMIRDNGFPGESMSEEEESLPYQPRG